MSCSSLPVRTRLTAGSNRSRYFRSVESQMVKVGMTAASVRSAILARPQIRALVSGVAEAHRRHGGKGAIYLTLRAPMLR